MNRSWPNSSLAWPHIHTYSPDYVRFRAQLQRIRRLMQGKFAIEQQIYSPVMLYRRSVLVVRISATAALTIDSTALRITRLSDKAQTSLAR